jgi:hypothetical protein
MEDGDPVSIGWMNPAQISDLQMQQKNLKARSAYRTARLVVNAVFVMAAVLGVGTVVLWLGAVFSAGSGLVDLPLVARAGLIMASLIYLGVTYVWWTLACAPFDIADACLASSIQDPDVHTTAVVGGGKPRQGGAAKWPEPPAPLIPSPPATRPEDAKYMPGGGR